MPALMAVNIALLLSSTSLMLSSILIGFICLPGAKGLARNTSPYPGAASAAAASSRPVRREIHIRGHYQLQRLPTSLTSSWPIWTLQQHNVLTPVETHLSGDGWLDPSSYSSLYLPSDLPMPLAKPALGIALANGVPRYIMPSVILTLDTPDKSWRNRGLCSLPRAWVSALD